MISYKVLQDRLFNRIHRTGEEIKNDFPNILRVAIKSEAWKHFKDAGGKPFSNLGAWLTYAFPNGCSMGKGRTAISYENALDLCSEDRELHGLLVKHRPSGGKGGRPTKEKPVAISNGFSKRHVGSTSRAYIEQRLQRDFPKIYAEYVSGAIKSARQAGIKAGFIKDSHDPLVRLKSYWSKASRQQRAAFLTWVNNER